MFGITYATPASIAYAEAESAAAAAAIAEEDRGTGDDEIGEHGRLEGGRGLEERRAEGESGDDEPPLELPLRVYLYPLPAAFNFGLLQAQWNVGCRLDILARHGVPPSWNFNSSSSSSSSSSATSSSLATSADDDADGDGDNSLDQAAAATVRAEEAADGERGERGAGGSNKAMKGVHLPMLEQADELARLAGWSEEAVAVQVPCYHNFPYYWQHSVEYYMTLSLLFGSEAVVRVEDPSHADVVFLPYFSTLAFRLKARPGSSSAREGGDGRSSTGAPHHPLRFPSLHRASIRLRMHLHRPFPDLSYCIPPLSPLLHSSSPNSYAHFSTLPLFTPPSFSHLPPLSSLPHLPNSPAFSCCSPPFPPFPTLFLLLPTLPPRPSRVPYSPPSHRSAWLNAQLLPVLPRMATHPLLMPAVYPPTADVAGTARGEQNPSGAQEIPSPASPEIAAESDARGIALATNAYFDPRAHLDDAEESGAGGSDGAREIAGRPLRYEEDRAAQENGDEEIAAAEADAAGNVRAPDPAGQRGGLTRPEQGPTSTPARHLLTRCPNGVGAGPSGTTFEHLRDAALGNADVLVQLHALTNTALAGKLSAEAADLLTASRLLAFSKPLGGTRPIAVGECLLRLIAKAALFLAAPAAREHFTSLKFGVAIAGGIESAIHIARTYLEEFPGATALQIDLVNAFNAVERAAVFEGLKGTALDSLVPLLRLSYGRPSALYLDHDFGAEPLQNARGVRQGDPLGPMLFAASIHPCLVATAAAHPEVVLLAYVDDITVLGEAASCTAAFTHLTKALLSHGLAHNLAKCEAWSATALDPAVLPPGINISLDGVRVLGSPIGPPSGYAARVRERLSAAAEPLPLLSQMDPQLCLLLLTRCVSRRASFLVRATPLEALPLGEWSAWGEELLHTYLAAAHTTIPRDRAGRDRIWQQAALPASLGGLGITNPAVEEGFAYLASVVSAAHLLRSFGDSANQALTGLLPLMDADEESTSLLPSRLAALEAELPPDGTEALQVWRQKPNGPKLQQALSLAVHKARYIRLLDSSRDMELNPLSGHTQRLQSLLGPGAGDWLHAVPLIPSLRLGPSQGGGRIATHHALWDECAKIAAEAGFTVHKETTAYSPVENLKADISIRHPDTARMQADKKGSKYAGRSAWVGFYAMAVETYGYPSPGVLDFFRSCAELAGKRRFNAAPKSREVAKLLTEYRQRWSVTLQRAQANALRDKTHEALTADVLGLQGPFTPLSEGQLYQLIEDPSGY
ncbi:unnamed protein product [Closterium sp. NIES-54]